MRTVAIEDMGFAAAVAPQRELAPESLDPAHAARAQIAAVRKAVPACWKGGEGEAALRHRLTSVPWRARAVAAAAACSALRRADRARPSRRNGARRGRCRRTSRTPA